MTDTSEAQDLDKPRGRKARSDSTPPSQKGVERKTKILQTTLTLIGRDGLGKLSMRSVATEANLPLGAIGYYFSGKEDLVREVFALHAARELQRVVQTISSLVEADSAEDLAEVLSRFVISGLQNPDNSIVAEYEFLVESSRTPDLARASVAWQQSLLAQLKYVIESRGSKHADAESRLVMAVMAGLEVDNLTRSTLTRAQCKAIEQSIQRLFRALSASWQS